VSAARDLRVAVLGAGMSGILCAVKLGQAGYRRVTVYEKAERVGGTWRENTYPGLSCDVPSHLYSYSFELNPNWSHTFSPGAEIQAYFEDVAQRHGVLDRVRFGDEVVACDWDGSTWTVSTASGRRDQVDVVLAATGVLHHPRLPDLPGLEDFAGKAFHSARWDHTARVDDARVGVVGTGSTACQIVGAVTRRARDLSLFQRTAQWIMPIDNPAYSEEDKAALAEDPERLGQLRQHLSDMFDGFSHAVVEPEGPQMQAIAAACRANLEDNVVDPELRERLRPDYEVACKRLIVTGEFYPAIQEPNATLVTSPIERVERGGVRTRDGVLHELDTLVLATGFKVDAFVRPVAVTGEGGRTLDEAWSSHPEAYLSLSVPGFPNFFFLNGPNGPVGNFSLIEVSELQLAYIMGLLDEVRQGRCQAVVASARALDEYEQERSAATKHTVWATGCNSWYLDDRGVPASWPWPFTRFRQVMATPDLAAFERR
jgi:cation diffusion facilitator CzcD-associated flavoprotein CzcO